MGDQLDSHIVPYKIEMRTAICLLVICRLGFEGPRRGKIERYIHSRNSTVEPLASLFVIIVAAEGPAMP